MSAGDVPPAAGFVEVSELLNSIARRQRILERRLTELSGWAPPTDRPASLTALQTARRLHDDARRLRASVAAVQTYLREQRAASLANQTDPTRNLRKPV